MKRLLVFNYIHYIQYNLILKSDFKYQLTHMYNLFSLLTIEDIIMSDGDLPSNTGMPIPGDCHLPYIHCRLPSSSYGRNMQSLII